MKKENGILLEVKEEDLALIKNNPEEFWKDVNVIGFRAFVECSSLERIEIPEGVGEIGRCAFQGCKKLKEVILPKSLTKICGAAFENTSIEKIEIPEEVQEVGHYSFSGCKNLKEVTLLGGIYIDNNAFSCCGKLEKINFSSNLKVIGPNTFEYCAKLKKIILPKGLEVIYYDTFEGSNLKEIKVEKNNGEHFVIDKRFIYNSDLFADRNVAKGYNRFKAFINSDEFENLHKQGKNPFPGVPVILGTSDNMVDNFYKHGKNWITILNHYATSVGKANRDDVLEETKCGLYNLSLILGAYSNDKKVRERAVDFILKNVVGHYNEKELHQQFGGLNTIKNGYIPEFAEFFINRYDDWSNLFNVETGNGSFLVQAYNRYPEFKHVYPYKTPYYQRRDENGQIILDQHGKEIPVKKSERIKVNDLINFLKETKYFNVRCEELAKLCKSYGYSQMEFETLQEWLFKGIERGSNINCRKDEEKEGITFELLEKNNPLGAVLGDLTNCCQTINLKGHSCVEHGMTNPNGGFMVFKLKDQIVGQAWVWYNPEINKICLDNIEVPDLAKGIANDPKNKFYDAVMRATIALKEEMEKNGKKVDVITMGKGYNDVQNLSGMNALNDVSKQASFALSSGTVGIAGWAPEGVYTDTKSGEKILYLNDKSLADK